MKRWLCALLVLVLCLGMLPMTVLAASEEPDAIEEILEETAPEEETTSEVTEETVVPLDGEFSGTCGKALTWVLENGVLTISGTDEMTDYTDSSLVPWYSRRASIASVVIEDGVTNIGDWAFYDCGSLTSITIPNSVTSIGNLAFHNCAKLASVKIPASVTSIGDDAFAFCKLLTNITIPDGVTTIGNSAFYDCSKLASVTLPDSVTSIGDSAFWECSSLTSITIPDSVTTIGVNAFYSCRSLASITVSGSVTSIGACAFSGCESLTDVYYAGTEAQWAEITIGSSNDCLTDAEIHYSEASGDDSDPSAIEFGKEYTAPQYTDPYTITLENNKFYYVEVSSGLYLSIRCPDTAWGGGFTSSGVFQCLSSGGAEVNCELCAMNSTSGTFTLYELADVVPEGNELQEGVNVLTVDDDGALYSFTSETGGTYLIQPPKGTSGSCYRETEKLWWWEQIQMDAGETVIFHFASTSADEGTTKTMTVMEQSKVPELALDTDVEVSNGELFAIPDLQQGWYALSAPNGQLEMVYFLMGDTGCYCLGDYFSSSGHTEGLYFHYTGEDGTISIRKTEDSDYVSVTLPEDLNTEIKPGGKLIRITTTSDVTCIVTGCLYRYERENEAENGAWLTSFETGREYVYASDSYAKLQTTAQYGVPPIALGEETAIKKGEFYTFTPEEAGYYSFAVASDSDSESEDGDESSMSMESMVTVGVSDWVRNGDILYFAAGKEYVISLSESIDSALLTITKADIDSLPAIELGKEYTDDEPLESGDYRFTAEVAGDYWVTTTGSIKADVVMAGGRWTTLPSVMQLEAGQSVYIRIDWRTQGNDKVPNTTENLLKIVDLATAEDVIELSIDSESEIVDGEHLYRLTALRAGTYTIRPNDSTVSGMVYAYDQTTGWTNIYMNALGTDSRSYTLDLKKGARVYLYGDVWLWDEEQSDGIWIRVTCDKAFTVSEQLDSIDNEVNSDTIRNAVQDIGAENLAKALEDEDSGVLEKLDTLEKSVKESGVTVTTNNTVESVKSASVTGAALNDLAEDNTEKTITLTIDPVDGTETALPDDLASEGAVYLDITLEGVANPHELEVPVVLTLAVPASLDASLLRIVHYKENADGEVVGTDVLEPTVFQDEDGQWYARFVVTGFSTFVLAQLARILGDFNGDGQVTILDVLALLKHVAGISTVTGNADVSGDGQVTILDVLHLLKFVARIIPSL